MKRVNTETLSPSHAHYTDTSWQNILNHNNAVTGRGRGGRDSKLQAPVYDILPLKKVPESDARSATSVKPTVLLVCSRCCSSCSCCVVCLFVCFSCCCCFSSTPTQERSAFGDGRGSVWRTNEDSSRCGDATVTEREPSLWRNPVQGLSK